MEAEVDLRAYFDILFRRMRVILGVTLAAGVGMYIFSSFQPRVYQATALVAITRPLYQFQFTPNILNLADKEAVQQFTGKAGVELAGSDVLLQQVRDSMGHDLKSKEYPLFMFKNKLKVSASTDPSILKLTATDSNPQVAATIANNTANLYVRYVNDLYGQSSAQEKFFEKQLAQAKNDLDKAEQALTNFQKRNVSGILQAELTARQGALSNYLGLTESLALLLQNVHSLRRQLSRQPVGNPSSLGDDLTVLMLQINAFSAQSDVLTTKSQPNSQPSFQPTMPFQLQISGKGNLTNGEQVTYLDELAKTIEGKLTEIKRQVNAMPDRILTLQGQLQKVNTENAQLSRQREIAQTMFTSLAQKASETRITAQETSGRIRVASYATKPEKPVGGHLTKTVLALVIGFLLSIFGVLITEYFRKPQVETSA